MFFPAYKKVLFPKGFFHSKVWNVRCKLWNVHTKLRNVRFKVWYGNFIPKKKHFPGDTQKKSRYFLQLLISLHSYV